MCAAGDHAAQVSLAEAAARLWAVAASPALACEVRLADVELPKPWAGTVSLGAPVSRADVGERLLFGPGSLRRAAPGATALPVEGAVTVERISWVYAEWSVLIPRGLASVVLTVRRVDLGASDNVAYVLPVTVRDPTLSAATSSHGVGSPQGSGTRHEDVDDLDVPSHFDRWVSEVGVDVGQQCLCAGTAWASEACLLEVR